jgi:hypothetical protein
MFLLISSIIFFLLAILTKGLSGIGSILLILGYSKILLVAIQILSKDSIVSVLFFIFILILGSVIPSEVQVIYTCIVLFLSVLLIFFNLNLYRNLITLCYEKIASISAINIFAWLLIFSYTLFLGSYDFYGFIINDPIHAPYSLSIGQSYATSFLNTPDLSYIGKELRYNFLFEQVPFFLANILGTSSLSAIYFELMFLLVMLSFIVISSFTYRHYSIPIPIFLVFFLPTYNLQMFYGESIFQRTLNFTPSYFVAFLLVVILIHLIINKKYLLLIVASAFLFNIKAMYLVTLMGGGFLFLLRKGNYKIFFLVLIFASLFFILLYYLFLLGSAEGAHWVIFPQVIYERIPTILLNQSIDLQPQIWVSLWVPLLFLYTSLFIYFNQDSDDKLILLSAISLSGLLGMFLITELVFLSSRHFYNAAAFPMVLTFYYWFKVYYLPSKSLKVTSLIPLWLLTYWAFILILELVGIDHQIMKKISIIFCIFIVLGSLLFIRKWSLNIKKIAEYSIWIIIGFTVLQKADNFLINNFIQDSTEKSGKKFLISNSGEKYNRLSNEFIEGYTWLNNNISDEHTVLNGKHYDSEISFIKSALSGKQFYSEGYGTKGLGLQKDFSARFANTIYFYTNFVNSSKSSFELLKPYQDLNFHFVGDSLYDNSLEVEQKNSFRAKLLFTLSLGKKWSWINLPNKINQEIKGYLIEYNQMNKIEVDQWFHDFLESQQIRYIVLENGDKPNKQLERYTDLIYENKTIAILSIKDERI